MAMAFLRRLPCAGLIGILLLGGCPLAPVEQDPATPAGDTAGGAASPGGNGGGPATTTDPGAVSVAGTFAGQLQQQFPDCELAASEAAYRDALFALVNAARTEAGLGPVRHDQALQDQATQYACELIQYDFFAHDNPFTGTSLADRATEFGYQYLVIGENLAAGQPTPEEAFEDWMNSPGHRANILDSRFTELGIGIRTGGTYGTYWVQEFGRPFTDPYPRPEPR